MKKGFVKSTMILRWRGWWDSTTSQFSKTTKHHEFVTTPRNSCRQQSQIFYVKSTRNEMWIQKYAVLQFVLKFLQSLGKLRLAIVFKCGWFLRRKKVCLPEKMIHKCRRFYFNCNGTECSKAEGKSGTAFEGLRGKWTFFFMFQSIDSQFRSLFC